MKKKYRIVTRHELRGEVIVESSTIQHNCSSFFGLSETWRNMIIKAAITNNGTFSEISRWNSISFANAKSIVMKLRELDAEVQFKKSSPTEDIVFLVFKKQRINVAADENMRLWFSRDFESADEVKSMTLYEIYTIIDDEIKLKNMLSKESVTYLE